MTETWYNPVIFSIGPISFRWYGALVVMGVALGIWIYKINQKEELSPKLQDSLFFHLLIGLVVGGRLGYVMLYHPEYYFSHLLQVFAIWRGGLSFHGALIGAAIALWRFCDKQQLSFFRLSDVLCLAALPLIFFSRIGNYINGEAYGRITDSFMGIIIPAAGSVPRHPSQLYEAFLEGIVLAIILWNVHKRKKFAGVTSGFFVVAYGCLRILAECFREADPQVGYFLKIFTMGQVLCLMMIIAGVALLRFSKKQNQAATS